MADTYDAVLIVSFGGPEGPDDVLPFLENVLRGRNIPRRRMLEVAEHYHHFAGASPINAQTRALVDALERELQENGPRLPTYLGNRNWHPLLAATLREMADDGISRALAFFPTPYSSYSSCRQYLENIAEARAQVGPHAPEIHKLRAYFNHPGFIQPVTDRFKAAMATLSPTRQRSAEILFSAHSIPVEMAANCQYEAQLQEVCRLVANDVGCDRWRLVYQSRSGPPQQPWLEPDICGVLRELASRGDVEDVVVTPVGFISDHMEVAYDLDVEAKAVCDELGLNMVRAATVGTHPRFVRMIRELIVERMTDVPDRPALGNLGPSHDVCPSDCCHYRPRRPT